MKNLLSLVTLSLITASAACTSTPEAQVSLTLWADSADAIGVTMTGDQDDVAALESTLAQQLAGTGTVSLDGNRLIVSDLPQRTPEVLGLVLPAIDRAGSETGFAIVTSANQIASDGPLGSTQQEMRNTLDDFCDALAGAILAYDGIRRTSSGHQSIYNQMVEAYNRVCDNHSGPHYHF